MRAHHVLFWVGLVAAGGSSTQDSCLMAYSDPKCGGEGVMQGNIQTQKGVFYGYKTGLCNAGDYGAVADRRNGKCENEDKVCKGVPPTCGEENCLSKECVMHSWCWRKNPACSRNLTMQPFYDHTKMDSLATAATICSVYGDAGNGWRVPTTGAVAYIESTNLITASSRIDNTSNLAFVIDAVLRSYTGGWFAQNGSKLAFNESDWAPGHPKLGSPHAGVKFFNGTLKLVSLELQAAANVSVLCDVHERTIALPTPAPTEPADGECLTLPPEEGVSLKPCETDECNSEYRTKDEALKKCCDFGPTCLGIIQTVVPTYLLGVDNVTEPTSGYTHRRTPGSFITPPPEVTYDGINPGVVGVLGLLVFLTFYCAIGMALRVQQGETTFPEVLPNYQFWERLGSDCGVCLGNICQIFSNMRPGYGQVPMEDMDMMDNDPMPAT